jgi:hypothetical protein
MTQRRLAELAMHPTVKPTALVQHAQNRKERAVARLRTFLTNVTRIWRNMHIGLAFLYEANQGLARKLLPGGFRLTSLICGRSCADHYAAKYQDRSETFH